VEDNSPNRLNHIISDINSWHNYLPGLQYAAYLDDAVANTYPGSEWNYIGGNKQTDIPLMNHRTHQVGWRFMVKNSADIRSGRVLSLQHNKP
jgi:hypothetical protein